MIEPRPYTYDEFPASKAFSEGMKTLEGNPYAQGCAYTADVEYAVRNGVPLHLQILTPSGMSREDKAFPLVVYVPGSAWRKQDIHRPVPMAARLASRGFVVAMVEYRPSDDALFPAQIEDAKAAVRFMKANAEKYRVNPDEISLLGDSSGGHTALMAAYTWGEDIFDIENGRGCDFPVRCVVDYYAPVNISTMNEAVSTMDHYAPDSPEGRLIGGKNVLENPELAEKTVVTRYISGKTLPPTLIVHGDKDRLVPFEQSVCLYDALKAEGASVEFYKLSGADHSGPAFWTDGVLDVVEGFIRSNI